jgi:hypothetical protein
VDQGFGGAGRRAGNIGNGRGDGILVWDRPSRRRMHLHRSSPVAPAHKHHENDFMLTPRASIRNTNFFIETINNRYGESVVFRIARTHGSFAPAAAGEVLTGGESLATP